jgi:uncharacterized protein YbjT (DUF2867 family)
VGDLEVPQSLTPAVENIDGVIFVHGSDNETGASAFERIDYGGVRNVLQALGDRTPRIVLMTTAFITHRDHYYNDGGHALDWKRRSERLVRLSRSPYTIVRPGTLDSGPAGEHVVIEQGDLGRGGGMARDVLGRVLVEALLAETAIGKTFEVFSGPGEAAADWRTLFDGAAGDDHAALDGAKDAANMPLESEPSRVREDLELLRGQ